MIHYLGDALAENYERKRNFLGQSILELYDMMTWSVSMMVEWQGYQFWDYCGYGDSDVIMDALNQGVDINKQYTTWGSTCLIQATQGDNLTMVSGLIKAGADVNLKDKEGRTALFHTDNPDIVSVLIKGGADVNLKSMIGWTYLMEIMDLLEKNSKNVLAIIDLLIEAGAKVDEWSDDGKTNALCRAIDLNNIAVFEKLIQAGADVNAKGLYGYTALMHASRYVKTPTVIYALIKAGADINAKDEDGWTALRYASWKGESPAVIYALIKAGADANVRDNSGKRVIDLLGENESLKNTDAYKQLKAYTERDTANLKNAISHPVLNDKNILSFDRAPINWSAAELITFFDGLAHAGEPLPYSLILENPWKPRGSVILPSGFDWDNEKAFDGITQEIGSEFNDSVVCEKKKAAILLAVGDEKTDGLFIRPVKTQIGFDHVGLFVSVFKIGSTLDIRIFKLFRPSGDISLDKKRVLSLKDNANLQIEAFIDALRNAVFNVLDNIANPRGDIYQEG